MHGIPELRLHLLESAAQLLFRQLAGEKQDVLGHLRVGKVVEWTCLRLGPRDYNKDRNEVRRKLSALRSVATLRKMLPEE
jgi:hypothetical protein